MAEGGIAVMAALLAESLFCNRVDMGLMHERIISSKVAHAVSVLGTEPPAKERFCALTSIYITLSSLLDSEIDMSMWGDGPVRMKLLHGLLHVVDVYAKSPVHPWDVGREMGEGLAELGKKVVACVEKLETRMGALAGRSAEHPFSFLSAISVHVIITSLMIGSNTARAYTPLIKYRARELQKLFQYWTKSGEPQDDAHGGGWVATLVEKTQTSISIGSRLVIIDPTAADRRERGCIEEMRERLSTITTIRHDVYGRILFYPYAKDILEPHEQALLTISNKQFPDDDDFGKALLVVVQREVSCLRNTVADILQVFTAVPGENVPSEQ